jgi:hypothetical protein
MRYLKTYKLFKENLTLDSVVDDLEDIWIDIIDVEKLLVFIEKRYNETFTHRILIKRDNRGSFESNDIIDYLVRTVDYFNSKNVSHINMSISLGGSSDYQSRVMSKNKWSTPVVTINDLNLEILRSQLSDIMLQDVIIEFNIFNDRKRNLLSESALIDLVYQRVEDLFESLNIWHDSLLSSINADELDIFDVFKLPIDMFSDRLDLDYLDDNVEFINSLSSLGLKKSESKSSEDFQTFLNKPCKFMFIYDINSNELENPIYLLFQTWNESLNKWADTKLYRVREDVKRFYDKLISRTIEIIDGDQNYIYETSNSNEWILQDTSKENDIYKKIFRREEIQDLLEERKVKIKII